MAGIGDSVAAAARGMAHAVGGLLDLVYPPRCLVCDTYDVPPLCEACAGTFSPLAAPLCTRCGRSVEQLPDGTYGHCHTCAAADEAFGGWAFEAARTAAVYEGPLRRALHRLKYDRCDALAEPLGAYLANRVVADELLDAAAIRSVDAVVAVPMSAAKQRRRGFNQAELLARPVADMLGLPLLGRTAVVRTRSSQAQVGLSPRQRRRNLAGAFQVSAAALDGLKGKTVLVIDDVFTTGATLHECARALKTAGVGGVYAATLASG